LRQPGSDSTLSRMSDFVIIEGDTLAVDFGETSIPSTKPPQRLSGSSPDFFVKGSRVCRPGDEIPPSLRGPLPYTEKPFTTSGLGLLAVSPKTTAVLKNGAVPLLLKGTTFGATFKVIDAAKTPDGVPDLNLTKQGTASFSTSNTILTAT
jgi:hypothetical protein